MRAGSPACESWPHMLYWDAEGHWTGGRATRVDTRLRNTRQRKATQPPVTLCTSGATAEGFSQLSKKKSVPITWTKAKVYASRSDPNQLSHPSPLSDSSIQESYGKTPSLSLGTVPLQCVGMHCPGTVSRHHVALQWGICHLTALVTGDHPRTSHACREQSKRSVLASDSWPLDCGLLFVPNETAGDLRLTPAGQHARGEPQDLVCTAMAMCPVLAAHPLHHRSWQGRTVLVSLNVWWAALLTELEKVPKRNMPLSLPTNYRLNILSLFSATTVSIF